MKSFTQIPFEIENKKSFIVSGNVIVPSHRDHHQINESLVQKGRHPALTFLDKDGSSELYYHEDIVMVAMRSNTRTSNLRESLKKESEDLMWTKGKVAELTLRLAQSEHLLKVTEDRLRKLKRRNGWKAVAAVASCLLAFALTTAILLTPIQ